MTTPPPAIAAPQRAAPGREVLLALVQAFVLFRATNQVDGTPMIPDTIVLPQQDTTTSSTNHSATTSVGNMRSRTRRALPPTHGLRYRHQLSTRYRLQVVPAPQATELARTARTQPDLAQALRTLREEAGLSLNGLVDKVAPLRLAGTSRTTIGRVCTSGPRGGICATPEALEALVRACGVPDDDVQTWLDAREHALRAQRRRGRRPASPPQVPDAPRPDAGTELATVRDDTSPPTIDAQDTDDDAVIGEVPFTARHLRTAITLSAIAGLTASTAPAPGMRHAGNVILGIAATLALVDLIRTTTAGHTAAA